MNVFNLLCFLECLNYSGIKHSLMANYLSAIKANFTILGLDVAMLQDMGFKYYQKAVQLTAPINVKLKRIIDIPLLLKIVEQCNIHGPSFQALVFVDILFISKNVQSGSPFNGCVFTFEAVGSR